MQTMETTTRELSTSTMAGLTLQSLHSKHPLRYSDTFCYFRYLHSGALRTGSVAFEAILWQNVDQLYDKGRSLT